MTLLLATAAAAAASTLVPVACTGQSRAVGLDAGAAAAPAPQARTYVLDDARRSILLYSPRTGGFAPVCDRDDGCRLSYGPLAVGFTRDTQRVYEMFALDRTAGTLVHVESRKDGLTLLFEGSCARVAMPRPEGQPQF